MTSKAKIWGLAMLSLSTAFISIEAHAGSGADAYIAGLHEFKQFGRVGSVIGCMGDSSVCNAGDQPLDWDGPPGVEHPFHVFNFYRLMDGRFQQIGQSGAKHSLGASQDDMCDFGCNPFPNNHALGAGCSDVYAANFNGNMQPFTGPRSEINPWTGAWVYEGSHISGSHTHNPISHRVQLHDDDLDAAQNPGAQYFAEIYLVAHDDIDHMNSATWSQVVPSGSPGGTWTFDVKEILPAQGPAILGWPGAQFVTVPQTSWWMTAASSSGFTATQTGKDLWHYEYAIYNHDMDRGVGGFTLPIAASVNITDIGFSAVASHDEPYDNDVWNAVRDSNALAWSTQSFDENQFANPIRWGNLYNFWFDADAPPGEIAASLSAFKPGSPAAFSAVVQGPVGQSNPGDINQDGSVDTDDLLAVINSWGPCAPPCAADTNQSGIVDVDDLLTVINNWQP